MTSVTKTYKDRAARLDTEVIQNILGSLSEVEAKEEPTPEVPLAGIVHVLGLGQISVQVLRAELKSRDL